MQKKRWFMLAGVVAALLSLALLAAACGDDEDDDGDSVVPTATEAANGATGEGGTLDVSVFEFGVEPSVDTVSAGTVTFNVVNDGVIPHNFKVVKTDLAPDALPEDDVAFVVDEEQVDVVAASSDLDIGETEEVTVDLEPGSYVLICNIATHYSAGTFTDFTVE